MARPREKRSRSFLPGDPHVSEPYRLTPQLALRVAVLGFLALTVFAVLFLRLWALQVLSGTHYLTAANNNRLRTQPSDAPRGAIIDRNGRVLVRNTLGTSIELWPADLPKGKNDRLAELRQIAMVAGVSLERILDRMHDIRLSEAHHGPPTARRFDYEPTWVLRGLSSLHLEFRPGASSS